MNPDVEFVDEAYMKSHPHNVYGRTKDGKWFIIRDFYGPLVRMMYKRDDGKEQRRKRNYGKTPKPRRGEKR